jgi:hypothetical protein
MQKNVKPLALGLTVASGLARLLPHPPNFTPVGSMSLFAGARIPGWMAYALPLLVMLVTDPFVGGYSKGSPFIYASFLISVWIGRRLQRSESPMRIGVAAFLCSLQFFVISNLATWFYGYPHTLAGLVDCYTLALPFFGRTLAGDLTFTALLFGLHAWLTRTVARSERIATA